MAEGNLAKRRRGGGILRQTKLPSTVIPPEKVCYVNVMMSKIRPSAMRYQPNTTNVWVSM